jgi:hypothetical protein
VVGIGRHGPFVFHRAEARFPLLVEFWDVLTADTVTNAANRGLLAPRFGFGPLSNPVRLFRYGSAGCCTGYNKVQHCPRSFSLGLMPNLVRVVPVGAVVVVVRAVPSTGYNCPGSFSLGLMPNARLTSFERHSRARINVISSYLFTQILLVSLLTSRRGECSISA